MPPDVAVDRQRGDSDEICYRVANLRHSGSFKERIPANSDVRKYPEGSDPRPRLSAYLFFAMGKP